MTQLALIPPHRNQQLFSDYYLDHILPQRADWHALLAEAAPVMAEIKAIYDAYTSSSNEAQLEAELARPVLKLLGHTFEVQAALKTPDGTKRPDYVFYRDQAAVQANKNKTLTDALLHSGAIAVGDAKAWDVSLDATVRSTKSAPNVFTNKNPSYQIAFYMQHSGLAWGILTNGRVWRLYHRDTAHKLDRFYEVDLPALLGEGQSERWLYFYAMFRRAAFDPGPLSLDAMLQASRDYARGVGDSLKTQVYDALLHLAQGFLDHPDNQLQPDAATLKTIYDHSLIVLYRLLFILYAEARDLLPLRTNQLYRDQYSLMAIKRRVAADLDNGTQLLPTSTRYWNDLGELFRSIDQGNPPLHVATFNGGLFDAARYPFLQTKRIGDARLQHAIDLLARVGGEFVDYRDLAERHLGTIYEGLLEYHLEPVGSHPNPSPVATGEGRHASAGEGAIFTIDLRNDKGERKATGSYYTPDYIVKYIVDQTVGPVLHQAVDGLADDAAIIKAVLDVNVLDPAMGSGHFLVEATERIARFLVDLGVTPEHDQDASLDRTLQANNPKSPIQNPKLQEADVAYWRRRVVQSCIYGVDLNPLAVDLAKLSLWLATVAQDRPLSFLDHHLRTGNALIGARIADLQAGVSAGVARPRRGTARRAQQVSSDQLSMLDADAFRQSISTAVDSMWLIESSPSASVADVKAQEQTYQQLRDTLTRRFRRLADLVTARCFGLQVEPSFWYALADYMTGRRESPLPQIEAWAQQVDQIARERRFFHWELEFPEVFFDRHGQPLGDRAGFDAVIGNPPYISAIQLDRGLSQFEKPFWKEKFVTAQGAYDIYVLFIEQCLKLVQDNNVIGLITPNKYLAAPYAIGLRDFLIHNYKLVKLWDVSRIGVFEDASVYPIVSLIQRTQPEGSYTLVVEQTRRDGTLHFIHESSLLESLPDFIWGFLLSTSNGLVQKIASRSNPLERICQVNASTTAAEADSYSDSIKEYQNIEPHAVWKIINTGLIDRYAVFWGASNLTHQHVEYERPVLPKQASVVSPNRRSQYSQPKIIFSKMGLRVEAFIDVESVYASMNTNFALKKANSYNLLYIGALCNSLLLSWVYSQYFGALRMSGGYYQFQAPQIKTLPIRRIAFTTPAAQRERLADKGRRLYEQFCQKEDYACVLGFVEHHLGGGERPVNDEERLDAKASGYTNEGHLRGLDQAAREGGLRSGSLPIHGPGNNDAGLGNNDAGLGNNGAEPSAHPVEPHATMPEHVPTSPEHVQTTTQPHANMAEPQATSLAQQSITAPAPDIVHDLLALLAEQMIDLHKQRQQAVEAFVLDLEGVLNTSAIDKLGRLWTPTTNADTSATADAQMVLGPLAQRRITLRDDIGTLNEAQWKWLTKRRLKHVPNFAQVVQVFRDHQPALAVLDQRIAATDRLIDQIVYRLYGLNEDEIALVEGGTVVGAPGS